MNRHDIEQLFQDEDRLQRLEQLCIRAIAIWLFIGTILMVIAVMMAH